jgi:hypothetical protein
MMKRIESIDGIEVTHRCYKPEQYEDADEPFDLVNFAWPHYEGVFTGYQDAEIHLWTTDNDSQLLRFAIKGKEIVEVYSEYGIIEHNPPNDFLLWVELSDINQPIEIIPPSSEDVVIMIPDKNIIPRLDVDSPYNQLPLPPDADLVSDSEYKWLKEVESIIEETGITPEIAKLFRPREFMAYINEFEYFLLEEKYDSNWSSVSEDRHPIYETDMKISSLIHFFADNMYDLGWILNDAVLELGYPNKFFLFFRRDNITLPIILEEGGENKARIEAFLPSDEATMDAIQSGWISYNESNSELAGNWITSIAVDQNGRAWIGSMLLNQGLSILSDGTLTNYTDIESEMGMVGIMSMNIDKDGLVWIGTYQDILTFDGESWNNFSEGDPRFIGVTDIVIDNDNNIWVSNETGISVYDGSNWKTYDPQFGGISLYLDDNGQPWITTNGGGVYSLDDETWDEQIPPKLDQQNPEEFNIRAIDFDSLGRLWVVSNGDDLSVFDGEDLTAIDLDDSGLNIQYIRDFSIDQFDRVWLITSDGRLFMLDTEGDWSDFTPYGSGISFSIPSVFIIDQQGRIWIGSKYDGVAVFTPPIP